MAASPPSPPPPRRPAPRRHAMRIHNLRYKYHSAKDNLNLKKSWYMIVLTLRFALGPAKPKAAEAAAPPAATMPPALDAAAAPTTAPALHNQENRDRKIPIHPENKVKPDQYLYQEISFPTEKLSYGT